MIDFANTIEFAITIFLGCGLYFGYVITEYFHKRWLKNIVQNALDEKNKDFDALYRLFKSRYGDENA